MKLTKIQSAALERITRDGTYSGRSLEFRLQTWESLARLGLVSIRRNVNPTCDVRYSPWVKSCYLVTVKESS